MLCALFSEVFCVEGFPLLYFHHSKDVFKSTCVCGKETLQYQREIFTPFINKRYDLYFGCKVGDQDKSWAPHICRITRVRLLTRWVDGSRHGPFDVPKVGREP